MIDALLQGRLSSAPIQKTAKNGSPFATCRLRVAVADGGWLGVSVITFSRSVIERLMALSAGAAVAMAGELKIGIWHDKAGEARVQADLQAHELLSEFQVTRRRRAMAAQKAGDASVVQSVGAPATSGADTAVRRSVLMNATTSNDRQTP